MPLPAPAYPSCAFSIHARCAAAFAAPCISWLVFSAPLPCARTHAARAAHAYDARLLLPRAPCPRASYCGARDALRLTVDAGRKNTLTTAGTHDSLRSPLPWLIFASFNLLPALVLGYTHTHTTGPDIVWVLQYPYLLSMPTLARLRVYIISRYH